ncbi:permease-like cell division protein FtsX [Nocardioides sp. CFH 31398]|uniref:permease-like cell division protein FtsX n=1 Tax=Nocardioides sp. CFH 31398 TaxID=2919579 RepID=UPI001F0684CE|nr:permease-like cell division protein FtsX [Nocardioides sp. CFH 31398]MCH1867114.1 permease-like cell division protein FtsX [Nocardioides sp. CFH 31398]
MQLRYVFSELAQGLRRNLTMHIAVVLTLFVSLTLVGLGVLLNQQADRAAGYWGSQLEVTVFLCRDGDDNPACTGEVTDAEIDAVEAAVADSEGVTGYRYESKEEAFEKVKELYGEERFTGDNPAATADAMPQSVWVELADPDEFETVASRVQGLAGVSQIRDQRAVLEPIFTSLNALQWGAIGIAGFLVLAALLLVGNTIRLAALARRREIGIMRLVGASNLYITLPFVLEALVTAFIGVTLAAGALAAFMWFGIAEQLSDSLRFMPWIGLPEYGVAVAAIAVLGPVLTVLPTLVLTRKYTKV